MNLYARAASLHAIEPCRMLTLQRKKFRSFLAAVPDFKVRLAHVGETKKDQSQNLQAQAVVSANSVLDGTSEAMKALPTARNAMSVSPNSHVSLTSCRADPVEEAPRSLLVPSECKLNKAGTSDWRGLSSRCDRAMPSTRTDDYS